MILAADKKDRKIRRDLFAIKVFGQTGAHQSDYVVTKVCRSPETMRRMVRELNLDTHRSYPLVKPRVVHPAQWVVDAYLAFGNFIED